MNYLLKVGTIMVADPSADQLSVPRGLLQPDTAYVFEARHGGGLKITGQRSVVATQARSRWGLGQGSKKAVQGLAVLRRVGRNRAARVRGGRGGGVHQALTGVTESCHRCCAGCSCSSTRSSTLRSWASAAWTTSSSRSSAAPLPRACSHPRLWSAWASATCAACCFTARQVGACWRGQGGGGGRIGGGALLDSCKCLALSMMTFLLPLPCTFPTGTGKTLIARQIGKMLNGKEPKIVNGPEVGVLCCVCRAWVGVAGVLACQAGWCLAARMRPQTLPAANAGACCVLRRCRRCRCSSPLPPVALLAAAAQVLNKYVGASEENIRNLFKDAESDFAKLGDASGGAVGLARRTSAAEQRPAAVLPSARQACWALARNLC